MWPTRSSPSMRPAQSGSDASGSELMAAMARGYPHGFCACPRGPPFAPRVCGGGSVRGGAAVATTLFDELGPPATVFVRVLFAALALVAVWRPSVRAVDA